MNKSPSIAIVGGGLAGLAAAAALAKFGFAAEVFEAAPQLGEIGAGVNVSPQAIRVLRATGLGEAVAAAANVALGVLTRDMHSGAALDYRDHAKFEARFGAPLCTFHRADLVEVLALGVDRSRVHLGHRLTEMNEGAEHVELHFTNGVAHAAELVIAADGIHSQVRRALYGDDHPAYTGQMVWRALPAGASVPADVLEPSGHVQWLGAGRHFFAYYLRGRDVVNIVTQQDTEQWVEEGWSTPGDVEELRASFPDPEPRLAALLDAVKTCSKWGLFLRPPTENWGRGRIQLIGDAAHAMLPNAGAGAGQAFEDAYILARWLAALPADPVVAMENFRRVRIPRAHAVQRISSSIVRAKHDYDPRGFDTTRAKVDAVNAMAWIWEYDAVGAWDREPVVPAVA
ncbi:MAG TPA: FAD-dependent monooxygenase [Xanthobacteraceae bacterium]